MKKSSSLLAMCTVSLVSSCGVGRSSAAKLKTVDDVSSLQRRLDGKYDVICRNGNQEVVTEDDIRSNNICDHTPTPGSSAFRFVSMQKRPDGKFNLICFDGQHEVATGDDIRSGKVCPAGDISADDYNYIVAFANLPLYKDAALKELAVGVTALVLNVYDMGSNGAAYDGQEIEATTCHFYQAGMKVDWAWGGKTFGRLWYRDPSTGVINSRWSATTNFIGFKNPKGDIAKDPCFGE